MIIGVCCGPEKFPQALDGIEYIEPTVAGLLCPAEGEEQFARNQAAADAAGAPSTAVNCLFPGSLKTTGPDVDLAAVDAWIETTCRRSAAAGVKFIVYGSGGSRKVPAGFSHADATEQILGHLKRFGPVCERHGVTLVLEPLNSGECNIVNSIDEGADLVRRAGHPNIRLLADTYHMALDDDPPEAIVRAGGLIVHAHCAEAEGRVPVGLGSEDHRPYFAALKKIGYRGAVSIEAKWADFEAELPQAVAKLREQIESA